MVAVVHVEGDEPVVGQEPSLTRHALTAHVDVAVDPSVSQHHRREGPPASGHVQDAGDREAPTPVGHVVGREAGRLLAHCSDAQVSSVEAAVEVGRQGHRPGVGVGRLQPLAGGGGR